jgi:hypothetical protein
MARSERKEIVLIFVMMMMVVVAHANDSAHEESFAGAI